MHQTKKSNQWYSGMKAHIGVDNKTKIVHTLVTMPANGHDSKVLPDLLHGDETQVWGDSAHLGQVDVIRKVIRKRSPRAKAFINKRAYRNRPLTEADKRTNRRKPATRSRGEHIFGVGKGFFGFRKSDIDG